MDQPLTRREYLAGLVLLSVMLVTFFSLIAWRSAVYQERFDAALCDHQPKVVLAELSRLNDRAFCFNLIDLRDALRHEAVRRDALVRKYNAYALEHDIPLEHFTDLSFITAADINGMIFQAHIDPWKYCRDEYGIRDPVGVMHYGNRMF